MLKHGVFFCFKFQKFKSELVYSFWFVLSKSNGLSQQSSWLIANQNEQKIEIELKKHNDWFSSFWLIGW